MTSKELFDNITPSNTEKYFAQLLADGMSVNLSSMYTKLIRDAARCNSYSSDVFYDLKHIERRMKEFNPNEEFEPIWIGFRKMGVDGTAYVLSRIDNDKPRESWLKTYTLSNNYFALYSITVENRDHDFYDIVLNEYYV